MRAKAFCERFGIAIPIIEAPMAGACTPERSAAITKAGGMGGLGATMLDAAGIDAWVSKFRSIGGGPLQINLWIPDPPPRRDADAEARVARFLEKWGPPVSPDAGDVQPQDFNAQCNAIIAARPAVASSIMGLYPAPFVERLKANGIAWFACATNVADARAAEAAGADAIVAQGVEAGGHRGSFDPETVDRSMIGLMALVPRVVDSVSIPVIAAGGIADGRAVAAALTLGASAVQVGTAFLRATESALPAAWDAALDGLDPENTMLTRAYSGRWCRLVATEYVRAATAPDAPPPAPYPVQGGLTAAMRADALRHADAKRIAVAAGQSAAFARAEPAGEIVRRLWRDASALLPSASR
jgi:nitronate monooxygenase